MSLLDILFGSIVAMGVLLLSFFFVTTRGSLLFFDLFPARVPASSRHVYWIYQNRFLVWLTDRKFIVSAVLLFQYEHLVTALLQQFKSFSFRIGEVVQLGAVSGDLSERMVKQYGHGARLSIVELTCTGIRHTMKKMDRARVYRTQYIRGDARAVPLKDGSVDSSLSFFLFHELPTAHKREALFESLRIVRPGGMFVFVEFHRPNALLLRLLGTIIFTLFEPHAKEMWHWDPLAELDARQFRATRSVHLGGYFQIVRIEKL